MQHTHTHCSSVVAEYKVRLLTDQQGKMCGPIKLLKPLHSYRVTPLSLILATVVHHAASEGPPFTKEERLPLCPFVTKELTEEGVPQCALTAPPSSRRRRKNKLAGRYPAAGCAPGEAPSPLHRSSSMRSPAAGVSKAGCQPCCCQPSREPWCVPVGDGKAWEAALVGS